MRRIFDNEAERIAELEAALAERDKRVTELEAELANVKPELEALRVAELARAIGMNCAFVDLPQSPQDGDDGSEVKP
jgi:hypothetical protein